MEKNRVIIVGSGPAGLFAARTILENSKYTNVIILEKGKEVHERKCEGERGECSQCSCCDIVCGGGGAGLYSDGKLVLDLSSGGDCNRIEQMSGENREKLCNQIRETLVRFDGVSEYKGIPPLEKQNELKHKMNSYGLNIKFYPVLHMGTNNLKKITSNFINDLIRSYIGRFSILYGCDVTQIVRQGESYCVRDQNHIGYICDYLILSVGKMGAVWGDSELKGLGCHFEKNRCYFGLRIETQERVLEPLLKYSFDPKIFKIYEDGAKMKMHCVCRNGNIRPYNYGGSVIVGGHTLYTKENDVVQRTDRCNFNLLMSIDPELLSHTEILSWFSAVSKRKLIVQRLGDFKNNSENYRGRSLPLCNMAQYGNIRKITDRIPEFSARFIEFIRILSSICPGLELEDNLLYGPAVEWTMDRVMTNEVLETEAVNLFAIGDGAGISQGIVYAAATGIVAAEEICRRIGK